MMTTPQDLEDFAVRFSLSEGIIRSAAELDSLKVLHLGDGIITADVAQRAQGRSPAEATAQVAGPTSCGLCGIESVAEAVRRAAVVGPGRQFSWDQIMTAIENISSLQRLNIKTRAVHAAAFWEVGRGFVAQREDVDRHNALDKLSGALSRVGRDGRSHYPSHQSGFGGDGAEKRRHRRNRDGIGFRAGGVGPSRGAAGIRLAAIARADGFEVFTHPAGFCLQLLPTLAPAALWVKLGRAR